MYHGLWRLQQTTYIRCCVPSRKFESRIKRRSLQSQLEPTTTTSSIVHNRPIFSNPLTWPNTTPQNLRATLLFTKNVMDQEILVPLLCRSSRTTNLRVYRRTNFASKSTSTNISRQTCWQDRTDHRLQQWYRHRNRSCAESHRSPPLPDCQRPFERSSSTRRHPRTRQS